MTGSSDLSVFSASYKAPEVSVSPGGYKPTYKGASSTAVLACFRTGTQRHRYYAVTSGGVIPVSASIYNHWHYGFFKTLNIPHLSNEVGLRTALLFVFTSGVREVPVMQVFTNQTSHGRFEFYDLVPDSPVSFSFVHSQVWLQNLVEAWVSYGTVRLYQLEGKPSPQGVFAVKSQLSVSESGIRTGKSTNALAYDFDNTERAMLSSMSLDTFPTVMVLSRKTTPREFVAWTPLESSVSSSLLSYIKGLL